MEKNNQPLILGIVVIGAVLIIALALIFTRSGDETATEPASENNVSENAENGNGGDNGGDNQQPVPTPAPQPTPQPIPTPNPTPVPTPAPQPGILPSDWDNLTDREKTDLNPFNCDHKTQWVSAEDGSCIDKTATIWNLLDPRLPDDVLLDELTMCPDNQDDCFGGIVLAVQNKDPWRLQAYIEWYRKEGELLNWTLTIFAYNGSDQLADYANDTKLIHHNYSDPLPADCPLGWIEIPDGCLIEN